MKMIFVVMENEKMADYIDRQAAIRNVCEYECKMLKPCNTGCGSIDALRDLPSIGAEPVVRCKDCRYRPYLPKECDPDESDGLDLVFPYDGKCPCECEDGWYSYIPEDDWFCANGKRKGD